jgi:N-acetyl-gamma-glutamyl-phosphate reductase
MFATVAENLTPYGLLDHRHTPEMETALTRFVGAPVEILFTPHLAPTNRGILATCYLRPTGDQTTEDLLEVMAGVYKAEPFIEVSERVPMTKATLGSNSVHITVRRDQRTDWIVAIGALDNLMKGAAGQAVQCANLALGLDETTGLSTAGVYP